MSGFDRLDTDYWIEKGGDMDHQTLKTQSFWAIIFFHSLIGLLLIFNGKQIFFLGRIPYIILYGFLMLGFLSTWAFGEAGYQERNFKCPDCNQKIEFELTPKEHSCPKE